MASVVLMENKIISKEGQISLGQKQGKNDLGNVFDYEDLIHYVFIPEGQTLNKKRDYLNF